MTAVVAMPRRPRVPGRVCCSTPFDEQRPRDRRHGRVAEHQARVRDRLPRLRRLPARALRRGLKDTVTIASVAAWRDELTARGLAPSSVTQRVSAVRRLAATLGADPLVQQVRCTHVQQDEPRALSDDELDRLLRQPDRRTTIGVRDRAILELLARAGLRRAELARLTVSDIQERGRQPDARRRTAIAPGRAEQTRLRSWCARPSAGGPGRCRCTPRRMTRLSRWYAAGRCRRAMRCSSAAPAPLRAAGGDLGERGRRRRRQARRRRRRARGPPHGARAAAHVLHDARRARRRAGSHPRARRPRRRAHHPDLRRRHRPTQERRHRSTGTDPAPACELAAPSRQVLRTDSAILSRCAPSHISRLCGRVVDNPV